MRTCRSHARNAFAGGLLLLWLQALAPFGPFGQWSFTLADSSGSIRELARRFATLGVEDPESWARSQINDGTQLARCLFLKMAWELVVDERDSSWIQQLIENAGPGEAFSGAGIALGRLHELGARDEDLIELVRSTQAELIFQMCYLLEGDVPEEFRDVGWRLFQVDPKTGRPGEELGGMHESVLGMDPSGREGKPRRA